MTRDQTVRVRPPGLVRVTRILKRLSVVAFLVFIVYLLTVAYSFGVVAKDIHPNGGSNSGTTAFTGTSSISTSQFLNVSNAGLYALDLGAGLVISTSSGVLLGHGSAPSTQIAAGSSGQLVLGALVSVAPGTPGQALLTNSETLLYGIWANVSVGLFLVVPVSVHLTQNDSWGAPFFHAIATASIVDGQATVSFEFENDASFSVAGVLGFQVIASGGSSCGSGSYEVSTPQGQAFNASVSIPTGCSSLAGGTFVATLSGGIGSPYSVQLPAIPITGGP